MLDRMLPDEPVVDGRGPAGTKAQITNVTQNFSHTHTEKAVEFEPLSQESAFSMSDIYQNRVQNLRVKMLSRT